MEAGYVAEVADCERLLLTVGIMCEFLTASIRRRCFKFRQHRLAMLSIFRVMSVYSLFAVRFFADVPFYSCVAGRIGMQVESGLHMLVSVGVTTGRDGGCRQRKSMESRVI